ncbi:hypothetical protein QJS10_CPB15g01851 [Acorus calamus]|uniref:Isopenicillin N synthase-like Fe(2+) 2OG dioxygenase domain-containing protein n=1 Tax=Acorus calamus TaxID=4465 RepID=A0AAV9D7H4_ACOCL|nr:hypothetical protein QJS10_CPB15g01851 [Acorus calamus]
MEGESEVIEPFELHHSDLLLLSSPSSSPSGPGEIEWLESVSRAVMKALGPSGPGLLAITGVERALELRRSLLSLSRRLALLDNDDRRRVLKDHGLGTDVSLKNPDRSVSSFVLHLNYLEDSILDLTSDGSSHEFEEMAVHEKELYILMPFMSYNIEYSPPGGHTYLQLFDANTDKILVVKTPPASFIVQVGESADILSKGKLRSTLHSVYKPMGLENVSRDTFVLFLQPAWNKTFSISDYPPTASTESSEKSISTEEMSEAISTDSVDKESHRLGQEIHRMIPPLFSRLKDGMTFAEFSRETTKQYYGGSGTQSVR